MQGSMLAIIATTGFNLEAPCKQSALVHAPRWHSAWAAATPSCPPHHQAPPSPSQSSTGARPTASLASVCLLPLLVLLLPGSEFRPPAGPRSTAPLNMSERPSTSPERDPRPDSLPPPLCPVLALKLADALSVTTSPHAAIRPLRLHRSRQSRRRCGQWDSSAVASPVATFTQCTLAPHVTSTSASSACMSTGRMT
jgi:hypothetical protein